MYWVRPRSEIRGQFENKFEFKICLEGGHWSQLAPTCTHIQCPPLILYHPQLHCQVSSYRPGGSAHCSCTPTHELIGRATLKCGLDGLWEEELPKCRGIIAVRTNYLIIQRN
ncbi:unnamed protein product [Meloidogyne enterolobii]|uniref:Uncharacterized protein n=1 Tax=Meloidogyne enterolobii TaxID=390850 RepID=A0ACB0ZES0_MELEN